MKSVLIIAIACLGVVALGFAFNLENTANDSPKPVDTTGLMADSLPKDSSGKALAAKKVTAKEASDTVTTESGLKYIIRKEGKGDAVKSGQKVSVHYSGRLTDGTEFDNSYKRQQPMTFLLGREKVIKGLDEGIVGMRVGETRTLIIPSDLGFGKHGNPRNGVPPDATLIFDVELVAIMNK